MHLFTPTENLTFGWKEVNMMMGVQKNKNKKKNKKSILICLVFKMVKISDALNPSNFNFATVLN